MSETYQFGVYTCQRCKQEYTVNDGTWRLCTPEFCHSCLEHLNKQYATIPVDKDGGETKQ